MRYLSVLDMIGQTPVVRLNRVVHPGGAEVWVKLESRNPGGSVKDRPAANMIRMAEASGQLIPGVSTVIEPTSGNTGIGLALVCAVKGYRCMITMPENATTERVKLLQAYGAEVHLTPAPLRMQGAIDKALELAAGIEHAFIPQQFENTANPDAHRTTTALEILEQMERKLDLFVLTAGTGGTVTGTGEVLRRHLPELQIYVVEPASSPVLAGGQPGPHKIPGTGPGFIPPVLNQAIYDRICHVTDREAQEMARLLARSEGLLLGASGAAALHVAIEAARSMRPGQRVLTIAPDSGERYLSSDLFG